jgi:pimeloyl-ACP methyl ester carboxylesterase
MSTAIRTEFIRANGLTFEVDICGDGERLALCLHGFPECAYSWRQQLPLLARLGYTTWAPNLRGYGRSSRPRRVSAYTLAHLCDDVAGLIDAAGKRSTLLIGHDWGGAISWSIVLAAPRSVERLVILNMPHPALFWRRLFRWPQLARSWYIFFFQLPVLPEWWLGRNDAQAVANAFHNMAVDKGKFPEEVLSVYRRHALQPGALTGMINYYRALARDFPGPAERRPLERSAIDIPVLFLWGECDSALGKELTFGTERYVRDLTLRYLPDVSHWVQQEAPETVNALLEAWLTGRRVPFVGPGGKIRAD